MTYFIPDCQAIELILKNEVLSKYGSLQGKYQINQIVNGKRSWKTATHAIWFVPEYNEWAIGLLDLIGTDNCIISSGQNQQWGLFDVPSFKV